ncbi:class II glutamine amidotransferase [Mobilicoccus massiliensis]|uniref:class II glutamine amidotransferase n=1 Tax=Mobilicoccus massiliensis TaxID=1522310 RepID=UPI00058E4259|nr:class II glutamine amidotransferase [Mobilicoccus massiliensis]
MCRLLAYVAPAPSTFSDVIGFDQGAAFQRLARLHADGWGTMWLEETGRVGRHRHAGGGFRNAELTNYLNGPRARAAVAHLRLATGGLSIREENTHPFVARAADVGLAHNGSILPVGDLRSLLAASSLRECDGATDSELYFALVRERRADGLDLGDAVTATVTMLRERFPLASLNAIVLDADQLVAVRASTHAIVPTEHFVERGIVDDDLPPAHDEAYYDLRVRVGDDGSVAFASSGLDTTGWEDLPLDSVSVVDLATVTMRTRVLSTTATGSFAVVDA